MSGRTLCGLVLVGIALGLTIGCGEPVADHPATYSVTGTVTLDGDPVEGAAVTFNPVAGGKTAAGVTDAAGKYALTTFEGGDGAVPGEYGVKIAQYEGGGNAGAAAAGEGDDDDDEEMMSAEYDEAQGEAESDGGGAAKNRLPEKYNDANTSDLKASVTEGENSFDFALKS